MGKRGLPPMPVEILEKRGSWRANIKSHTPECAPGAPRMPSDLSDAAKKVWKRAVPELERMGVVGHADRESLVDLVENLALRDELQAWIDEHGATGVDGKSGNPIVYPAVREIIKVRAELARQYARFGMTPSDRAAMGKSLKSNQPEAKAEKKPDLKEFKAG